MQYFPSIQEEVLWSLQVIAQHLEETPGYFEDPDCPYPDEFKALFKHRTSLISDTGEIDLEQEAHDLFIELRESNKNLTINDHTEKMAYFRTATSLLDKLVAMRERAANVKQVSQFYETVLNVMDEFLEPSVITQVRERLKEFTK